jgi:dethiobiotin synthetase
MRGLFVTGTGTGVGKSVLSAALLAAMAAGGESVRAYKPVLTGLDEPADDTWPRDHELLGSIAGMSPEEVSPLRFGPAVSPHFAAELAGLPIDPQALLDHARRLGGGHTLLVEGVGGLMVPLAEGYLVRDLAGGLGLPLVVAARPGLGTISDTLLTLEAARAAGLAVAAVVLGPWAERPSTLELSNLATIQTLGQVEVHTLKGLASPALGALTDAGSQLPWREWLEPANSPPS